MNSGNQTASKHIVLLGFHVLNSFKIPFFLLILILYSLTVTGNIMIVMLVSSVSSLHHPMFFFLSHLSLSDAMLTTNIVPIMLCGIIRGNVTLSIAHCITQFQMFGASLASESLLLAVMSFDRYLAICNPLQYKIIMNNSLCLHLVCVCWFLSFALSVVGALTISTLTFCGRNTIDHFFCDFFPILQLSCTDTSAVKIVQVLIAAPAALFPVVFIIISYIYIFITVLRIPSTFGKQKAFSTFSCHLSVVWMFFGSLISLYVVPPSGIFLNANKVISLLYTVITPLFNPIIYSLRNLEIRIAFKKYIYALKTKT